MKSNLLKCLENLAKKKCKTSETDAMLVHGAALVNMLKPSGACKTWSEKNCMFSNSKKCKELVMRKKTCRNVFTPVFGIPHTCELSVFGLILQDSCEFDCHVHVKLIKANNCSVILRSLLKEDYSQAEFDHLFSSIVLPIITYGLPVYGASEAELTAMQFFLDRCYKRKYTSKSFSIKHLLEKQDRKVFSKVSGIHRHLLLRVLLPKKKVSTYNLRNQTSQFPKVKFCSHKREGPLRTFPQ